MQITITREQAADVIDQVLAAMRTGEGYRPHDPVVCSDGVGVEIGSGLAPWAWSADVDGIEAWLANATDGDTGATIVAGMSAQELADMLGMDEDATLVVEGDTDAATDLAMQIVAQMNDDDRRDFDEDAWREGIAGMVGPGTDTPGASVDEVLDAITAALNA